MRPDANAAPLPKARVVKAEYAMTSLEQRWLDDARRTNRCPECSTKLVDRYPSRYCSIACVDMVYRREIELPREATKASR